MNELNINALIRQTLAETAASLLAMQQALSAVRCSIFGEDYYGDEKYGADDDYEDETYVEDEDERMDRIDRVRDML